MVLQSVGFRYSAVGIRRNNDVAVNVAVATAASQDSAGAGHNDQPIKVKTTLQCQCACYYKNASAITLRMTKCDIAVTKRDSGTREWISPRIGLSAAREKSVTRSCRSGKPLYLDVHGGGIGEPVRHFNGNIGRLAVDVAVPGWRAVWPGACACRRDRVLQTIFFNTVEVCPVTCPDWWNYIRRSSVDTRVFHVC